MIDDYLNSTSNSSSVLICQRSFMWPGQSLHEAIPSQPHCLPEPRYTNSRGQVVVNRCKKARLSGSNSRTLPWPAALWSS